MKRWVYICFMTNNNGENMSIEVGTGVTLVGYSDRTPFEVVKVVSDKTLEVRRMDAAPDLNEKEKTMQEITINETRRLFVIPCGNGYSCMRFEYVDQMNNAIRNELAMAPPSAPIGSIEQYSEYERAVDMGKSYFEKHNRQMSCGLHPKLKGLEGYRIECTRYGKKVRFWVGKSTGWIPCHLAIHNSRSCGGDAISLNEELNDIVIIRRDGRK